MIGDTLMRKNIFAICAVVAMGLAVLTIPAKSQQPKPSPAATTQCQLPGGKTITTNYSSPRMKGRKIFGDLVPWGKVWRAGANEATTFVTTADVNVGGKTVPAGSYTIFVVPTADKWTLIVQKTTGEWGIPYPPPQKDLGELLRTDMKVSSLPAPLENFTIAYDQTSGGCTLHMDWETTRASVDITPKM
jgi:hypothetical protein